MEWIGGASEKGLCFHKLNFNDIFPAFNFQILNHFWSYYISTFLMLMFVIMTNRFHFRSLPINLSNCHYTK